MSLVDRYFLTPDQKVGWPACELQGQVIAEPEMNVYLVQLNSWIWGEPTEQRIYNLAQMADWHFFETIEQWHSAAERASAAGERLRAKLDL